ncbi:MAG: hypothetical protein HC939_03305 [Pleurocapsa sp. SU_5_0]|nr:hypothetical protein [Pleurocapsa sp. SU_5_0]
MHNYQNKIYPSRLLRFIVYLISVTTLVICLSFAVHHPVVAQNELTDELEIVAEFPAEHPPAILLSLQQAELL